MKKLNILLLEDDATLSKEIQRFLLSKEMNCDIVFDGELFFRQLNAKTYDILLLDINVPKMNGLDVCEKVRELDKTVPILMLTAFGEIEDKITAFQKGADDYLVKPFHLEELFIRMESLLRRRNVPQNERKTIVIDDLVIDLDDKTVTRNKDLIALTPKEYKLLVLLANAQGRVMSKQQIADELWDYHIETSQNTIEVYINFLRNKIDKPYTNKLLHTKVGYGYFLEVH